MAVRLQAPALVAAYRLYADFVCDTQRRCNMRLVALYKCYVFAMFWAPQNFCISPVRHYCYGKNGEKKKLLDSV